MEDNLFDFMSKLYSEFSSFKAEVNSKLDNIQVGQQKIGNDVTEFEIILKDNSKTLFDGYRQTYEEVMDVKNAVNEISRKVDRLSDKIDKQEVEIKVIKGGKA
jgi:hypothetical protein